MHQHERPTMARRSLLAGISAAPAVIAAAALPSAVLANPAAPAAMSAEVAELTRLYEAAMARTAMALEACEAAEARRPYLAKPEALFWQTDDPPGMHASTVRLDGRWWYGDEDRLDALRTEQAHALRSPIRSASFARRVEILAAYDQWQADIRAAEDAAGITAANAEYRAAWDEQEKPIRLRIVELRSIEPAALRLKARLYLSGLHPTGWRTVLDECVSEAIEREGGPHEEAITASIIRDLVTAYASSDA